MPSPFAHQWGTDWSIVDAEFEPVVTLWADDIEAFDDLTVVEREVYAEEVCNDC